MRVSHGVRIVSKPERVLRSNDVIIPERVLRNNDVIIIEYKLTIIIDETPALYDPKDVGNVIWVNTIGEYGIVTFNAWHSFNQKEFSCTVQRPIKCSKIPE